LRPESRTISKKLYNFTQKPYNYIRNILRLFSTVGLLTIR